MESTHPHVVPRRPGRRRFWLALLFTTLWTASFLLAACNRFSLNLPFLGRADAAPTPVGITIFAPADDGSLRRTISVTALSALSADVTISPAVTVTSLTPRLYQQLLAGRRQPDVLVLNLAQVDELVEAGQLAPLALSSRLTANLDPRLLAAGTRDGQLYCAPHSVQTLALFYNRAQFDQAGAPYPDATWTWDDLRAAAVQIEELPTVRFTPFGLGLSPDISRWYPFLLQAASTSPLDDPAAVLDDPAALDQGLRFVTGLYSDTLAATPGYFSAAWAGELFGNGRVAMTVEGNWLVDYLAQFYPELEYGIAPLPRGASAATVAFGLCVAAGARTAHPERAQRVLAALLDADLDPGAIPARQDRQSEWQAANPRARPFLTQLDQSALWAGPWVSPARIDAYQAVIRGLLDGELSRAEAISALTASEEE